jgi:hypothetical protein
VNNAAAAVAQGFDASIHSRLQSIHAGRKFFALKKLIAAISVELGHIFWRFLTPSSVHCVQK